MTESEIRPRFPLYVPTYGRYENCLTSNVLDGMGVDHYLVIENDEYDDYAAEHDEDRLLVVPARFHDEYETYDDIGSKKSKGPGPARNFAWHHATENGYDWHWVMDDNIKCFHRYHNNKIYPVADGTIFRCMEDYVLQYENVAMAGPRYYKFTVRRSKRPPTTFNTRIYSCNLIRNDVPYDWAGRYNEDTDLSLRMLKDGWCTVVFNTYIQEKLTTQYLDGGNTENFYKYEGTYAKSKMLKEQHPAITSLVKKYGRWHHEVNYQPFKANELERRDDVDIDRTRVTFDLRYRDTKEPVTEDPTLEPEDLPSNESAD